MKSLDTIKTLIETVIINLSSSLTARAHSNCWASASRSSAAGSFSSSGMSEHHSESTGCNCFPPHLFRLAIPFESLNQYVSTLEIAWIMLNLFKDQTQATSRRWLWGWNCNYHVGIAIAIMSRPLITIHVWYKPSKNWWFIIAIPSIPTLELLDPEKMNMMNAAKNNTTSKRHVSGKSAQRNPKSQWRFCLGT